jgi:Lrp/AsnC family transcriptional regulator
MFVPDEVPRMLDKIDRKLLAALQQDSGQSVTELAAKVPLSVTPCWRRLQRLDKEGYIRGRVALLDAKRLNVGVTVFIEIRVARHTASWLETFGQAVKDMREVVEVYRLSGQSDYLLKAVVPDIGAYDAVYKRLIGSLELFDVRSSFAMETIKCTTELPLDYAV